MSKQGRFAQRAGGWCKPAKVALPKMVWERFSGDNQPLTGCRSIATAKYQMVLAEELVGRPA